MTTTIQEVLEEVHRKYTKDTEYPAAGEDDFVFRLQHANDGIALHESEVFDGTQWDELIDEHTASAAGTGSDDLPTDFLATLRSNRQQAVLYNGPQTYYEVEPAEGMRAKQTLSGGNHFWIAGGKIKSSPSISGSFTLPYLRQETRYEEGTETDPIDMKRPLFLVFYILSMLYLKDRNAMGFNANQQLMLEEMRRMKTMNNRQHPSQSGFGIGM